MQKGCGGGGGGCCAVLQGLTKQLKHCGVVCQCCRVWDALTGNSFLTSSQCSLLQFERVLLSSVQDGIYALRKAHVHSAPSLRSFPNVVFEMVPTTNNGPLLSFQGRSSRTSSFHASLLQAIGGVRSLAFCLQVVSQAPQHFRSSEKKALVRVALPASVYGLLSWPKQIFVPIGNLRSFPFTPACPRQYTCRSFWRWMLSSDTFQRKSTETHPPPTHPFPLLFFLAEQWGNVHTYCKHNTWIMEQNILVFAPFPKTVGSKHSTLSATNNGLKIFRNF